MSTTTAWHTIREASVISGLPESTLRYYEQIGISLPSLATRVRGIAPIRTPISNG